MIRVRCGTPVTTGANMTPEHIASSFVFDTRTLQLYLDLTNGTRVPVRDPMVLQEIENGITTKSITVLDGGGTRSSNIILGANGDLTFDTPLKMEMVDEYQGQHGTPEYKIAVFDEEGHLQYVSFEDLASDIGQAYTELDVEETEVVKGLTTEYDSELLALSFDIESVVKSVRLRS